MSSDDASSSRGTQAPGPSANPLPSIDTLFHLERIPNQLTLLCLYMPLGVVLGFLRVFICFHTFLVTLLLPKTSVIRCYIVRAMCTILGLVVIEEEKNRDPEVKVFVANHVSIVDHWMLDLLQPCVLPSVWDIPCVLNWGHIYKSFSSPQEPNVVSLKSFIQSQQNVTLLGFPEAAISNGTALMRFTQTWPFELDVPVQAVAIKASRSSPFRDLSIATLDSSWFADLVWLLFCPWTTFHICRLPAVSRGREETVEEFSQRVAEMLAAQLGVRATPYTKAEKQELVKRLHRERLQVHRRSQEANARSNLYLVHMANQVKEVLPDVPLHVIMQDLQETNSVDSTISRIIDGVVSYIPEKRPTVEARGEPSNQTMPIQELLKTAKDVQVTFNTSASSFGSTAQERFQSYHERKTRLIENARMKYIQKHGIKI
ncbi:ancient ubiquitous protein 1 homolog [Galendromus occidentalis]|uniref:Lipid droplet-regulating VLDL assembly factor AUP1 n=1 Tax=Galendromus occidentalis TaxID=34638 RepID=A0AAJ7SGI7_9ACAR|nr:ancient ubiquitous protein 1 homolog [Galendromus occidentalis]